MSKKKHVVENGIFAGVFIRGQVWLRHMQMDKMRVDIWKWIIVCDDTSEDNK